MTTTIMDAPQTNNVFDLLIRAQAELDRMLEDPRATGSIIRMLLSVAILGLVIQGAVVGGVAAALEVTGSGAMLWMPAAFVIALLGALSICLPSFYFYTQLSGLDASFRLVTAQALRAQATTSVFIFGFLPFYAAWALGATIGVFEDGRVVIAAGMALPFVVGLIGLREVYRGFVRLSAVLEKTHPRRGDVLTRMVLCWGAVYSAVAPIALWRISEEFGLDLVSLISASF
jgi:hypothetical protein